MRSYRTRHWLLVGGLFLIIFVRAPGMLLFPPLEVEDGQYIFALFFNHRDADELWRFRMGYMHPYSNSMGFAAARLPVRAAPYVLAWGALLAALATYSIFHTRRYRVCLPSDTARALVCLALLLDPFASHHFMSHAENLGWNGLLAIMLLTLLPAPRRRPIVWFTAVNLLAYSHPLSLLALPLIVRWIPRARGMGQRIAYVLTALNLVAWHVVSTVRIGGPTEMIGYLWLTATFAVEYLQGFVLFRAAFGHEVLQVALRHVPWVVAVWSMLVVSGLVFTFVRGRPAERSFLGGAAYIAAVISFAAFYVRGETEVFGRPLRFGYVPAVVLFVSTSVAGTTWIRRWRLPLGRRRLAAGAALAWFAMLNVGHAAPYQAAAAANGRLVFDFMHRLSALQRERGDWRCLYLRLEKVKDWPIVINTLDYCRPDGGPP